MYTVFLSGFMACGKTTVGQTYARRTGAEFIDLDEYIEKKQRATVAEIFRDYGEEYFRKIEAECLRELCGKNAVVACGGGTMTDGKNYGAVRLSDGFVVFIDTPFPFCRDRIRKTPGVRPVADERDDEQLEELYNTRRPLYLKNSDCTVSGVNPSLLVFTDIVTEVAALIEKRTDADIALVESEMNGTAETEEETE
jgi:shikimate kinase